MKKSILTINSILIGLLLFMSCSDDESDTIVKEIKLSTNEVILKVGAKQQIKIAEGNGTYKVTSSDDRIQVDNTESTITITGKSVVEGIVSVTDSQNKKAIIKVTISDKLSLGKSNVELELNEGNTNPVTRSVSVNGDIDNISIKSTDTKVADAKKVKNSEGVWNIEITAKGEGTSDIEVTDGDTTEIIKVNVKLIKKTSINIKVYDNSISKYVDVDKEYLIYDVESIPNFKLDNLKNYTFSFDMNNEYKAIIDNIEDIIIFEAHANNTTQDVVVTITEKSNPENKKQFTLKRKPLIVEFSRNGTKIDLVEEVIDSETAKVLTIKKGEKITVSVSGQKGKYLIECFNGDNGDDASFTYKDTNMNVDDERIVETGTFSFTPVKAELCELSIMDTETEVFKNIYIRVEE